MADQQVEKARGGRVLAVVGEFGGWMATAVVFVVHLVVTTRNFAVAHPQSLALTREAIGGDIFGWVAAYAGLFTHPETWLDTSRIYALWIVLLFGLSIYAAIRVGEGVLYGAMLFLSHVLAAAIVLAIVTPAAWVLFAGAGPVAAAYTPPFVLAVIALFMRRSVHRAQ